MSVTFCNSNTPTMTITISSAISKSAGMRKFLLPQKLPRSTAKTEENTNPSIKIRNTGRQRKSENKNATVEGKHNKKTATGRVKIRDKRSPAPTLLETSFCWFSALLFAIKRETVMGIPPVPIVRNTENTERET